MRPLKLIMQAFGPYAKKEEIDFKNLGNRTMFVISGKTGAGKTTIFDGISYAIYGKASGEDRNGTELRSQFAEDDLLTEVSLEFSLRDKTYYIWRSPQQEKKKARGDGFTTVGAKAELYVINDDGKRQLLAANVRDADEKIKEIIQLDANQFRQILMIPQGEFRKLLTSDSKDKEIILQRLFHTELYKLIEEKLKEEATTIKNMVESKVDERSQHLRSIYVNDNEALTESLGQDTLNVHTILPLVSEQISKMKEQLDNITQEYEEKKKKRDEAKKSLDEASALLLQFENMNLLKKRKNELLEQKTMIESKKIEIDNAYKAARLEQQDLLCHRLKKEYDAAIKEYNQSESQLKEAMKALELAEKQYKHEEEKTEKRQQLADELYKLTNLKEEVYSFAERKLEVVSLEKEQQKLIQEESSVKEKLQDKEKEIETKRIIQKSLSDLTMKNFEMEKELEKVISIKQKLNKLKIQVVKKDDIISVTESKRILFENVQQRLQDAKSTFANLEHQWQAGQAGLLAQKLIEGNPCPVCGSLEHPNPNMSEGAIPNENDLEAAKNDLDQIEKEKSKAETDWLEIKATHTSFDSAIKEQSLELSELLPHFLLDNLEPFQNQYEDKYSKLSRSIHEQKEKLEYMPQLENELEDLESQIKQYRNHLETIQEKQKMITQEYIGKKTAVENSIQNIPEDIRTKEQYNEKLSRMTLEKQQLEQAFEIASKQVQLLKEKLSGLRASTEQLDRSVSKADNALKKEREQFILMLEEEGFSGYQQFSQSKKTNEEIKQLEQYVQSYGEELRSVSDRYQDISERLTNVEQPNLDLLKQQFLEIEHLLLKLNEEQTNMKMNIRHNENIIERVSSINETIKEAEQKYQLVGHLADISRGQNTYRITFERYVLAAFLDDILHVANSRLTKMTGGRYHLLRKTDRSKGNVQSGLELLIFDQYTGQERHVKTLSGGESFKAALALALGLADVVQQYAGGVSLETMFIDEGFGTLDPESLDHAIEALMDIQSSGRLVGIISHVPELKERIDARLEVISGQNGSRTEFQFFG